MAEALHTLPYAGGLFDQPPGALFRMEAVLAASSQPDTARANREQAERNLDKKVMKGS